MSRRLKRTLPDWVGQSCKTKKEKESDSKGENKTQLETCTSNSAKVTKITVRNDNMKRNPLVSVLRVSDHNQKGNMHLSTSDIILQSLPFIEFKGSVIYSYNASDCSLLCEELISSVSQSESDRLHVGFDLEWPVSFTSGAVENKVALIQICPAEDKCYLFHIAAMGTLPSALKTLISHGSIIKYGINIEADFWKLERGFDIQVREILRKSVIDLGTLANAKLKSSERWTLDGLARNVLQKRLDKNMHVCCGDWDNWPLSENQMQYAAADAFTCYLLADKLMKN